jgi:hypothetical protein
MFTKKSKSDELLEREIEGVLVHLHVTAVDTEEYPKVLSHLERLYDLKGEKPEHVKKDTMAIIGGNLLGILMILKYERVDVITSKALSFVIRAQKP